VAARLQKDGYGRVVMGCPRPLTLEAQMKILASRLTPTTIQTVFLALLAIGVVSTPSRADTGIVSAVVSKGGFIVGFGGGRGTLILHGHSYPLVIGGMSFGATIGLSTPI
jgi:hypothetical protein